MFRYLSDRVLEVAHALEEEGHRAELAQSDGICPVTEDKRLIVTGFLGQSPQIKIPNCSKALPRARIATLLEFLNTSQGPAVSYMVWNLSGESYDYAELEDQVVECNLGMHPAPPFEILVQLVDDICNWLDEDSRNVAVVHDLSGRRSAVLAACCLLKQNPPKPENRKEAISNVLRVLEKTLRGVSHALIPSQLRYIEYFAMRSTVKTCARLKLQRLIVNGIPDFVNAGGETAKEARPIVCMPFMKLFMGDKLIAGTIPEATYNLEEVCFSLVPIAPFPTGSGKEDRSSSQSAVEISGDVLLRCFHQDSTSGTSFPMFAIAFHCGFIQNGVLRLYANEIDGAKENGRFPRSFFVDLIFAENLRASEDDVLGIGTPSQLLKPSRPSYVRTQTTRLYKTTRWDSLEDEESLMDEVSHRIEFSVEPEAQDKATAAEDSIFLETLELEDVLSEKSVGETEPCMDDVLGDQNNDLDEELRKYEMELELMNNDLTESGDSALDDDFDIDAFAISLNLEGH